MSTQATLIVPEVVNEAPPVRAAGRSAQAYHASLWLASLVILAAAVSLEVRDGTKVWVPLVNQTLPEMCYWRVMFDTDCPGCGMTRCFISAAHADPAAAWGYNPLGLLLFAALLSQIPYRPWQLWRVSSGRGEFRTVGLPYAMLGISVLLLLQWFWRMLF